MDPTAIRDDTPGLTTSINDHQLIYLDNAATTQTPSPILEHVQDQIGPRGNPGRSGHTLSHRAQQLLTRTRRATRDFTGMDEIVYTYNATDSINQAARITCPDDLSDNNIVITQADHHANYLPWKKAAERTGADLRVVPVEENGKIDIDALEDAVDGKTHVLAFPHACNVTGQIFPIETIASIGEPATYTVLDASQTIGHLPVDLGQHDIDLAVFSPHKMLALPGIGILAGRDGILNDLPPARYGGGMVEEPYTPRYRDAPSRHEAGTINTAGVASLEAAIEYLTGIGMEEIKDHNQALTRHARQRLQEIEDVSILGSRPGTGTVAFTVEGIHPHDIAGYLDHNGIQVRAGDHCSRPLIDALEIEGAVRVSTYIYNTRDEIETTLQTIEDAIEELPNVQR